MAAPGVASAAVTIPTTAPDQRELFPGVSRAFFAWQSWQSQFSGQIYATERSQRLTWPDATVWEVGALDGISGGPIATAATILDPWGAGVSTRRLARSAVPESDWLLSASNREWLLTTDDGWSVGAGRWLVSRDATGAILSTRQLPKGRSGVAVVAGAGGGPMVVATSSGRSSTDVRLLDARLHTRAVHRLDRRRTPNGAPIVTAAQPLVDGSAIVAVTRKAAGDRTRTLLVRLRPGHRSRVLWSGGQISRLFRLRAGVVGMTVDRRMVAISDRGRVQSHRLYGALPGALASCRASAPWWQPGVVATSGRLILGLRCEDPSRGGGYAIEFTSDGVARAAYDLSPVAPTEDASGNGWRLANASSPLPDGSLPFQNTVYPLPDSASGWSTWLPAGSIAPRRGTLKAWSVTDATKSSAVRVQVTCRAPFGQICSGVAEVRAGGRIVGSTRYSLPGRPGKLAATDRFDVALSEAVSAVDRKVTAAPLPPRPLLNPPKPSWDGSQPY